MAHNTKLARKMAKKKNMENDRGGGEYFRQKERSENMAGLAGQ